MAKKDILTVANLMVIEVDSDRPTPALQEWRKKNNVMRAENCARQVLYGPEEDLKDFKDFSGCDVQKRYGSDAYVFLLKVLCGFMSPRFGETHVKNQFFNRWKSACKDPFFPKKAVYEPFIGKIRRDINYVQDNCMDGFVQPEYELIARDLVGEETGDNVIVVGSVNLRGYLAKAVERVMRVSENKQAKRDQFMSVTHPDSTILSRLGDGIKYLKGKNRLRSCVDCFDYENIAERIAEAHRVYVCSPMGEFPAGEELLIEIWKRRAKPDAKMIHMMGDKDETASEKYAKVSSGIWCERVPERYVSPEDINEGFKKQEAVNYDVAERVERAFEIIADIRLRGDVVRVPELRERAPDIFPAYENG